jgi:hypothetical protein
MGKGKTCATPALEDEGCVFQGIKNALHGIFHRKDKACSELTQFLAGIDQCRGIRKEQEVADGIEKPVFPFTGVSTI